MNLCTDQVKIDDTPSNIRKLDDKAKDANLDSNFSSISATCLPFSPIIGNLTRVLPVYRATSKAP